MPAIWSLEEPQARQTFPEPPVLPLEPEPLEPEPPELDDEEELLEAGGAAAVVVAGGAVDAGAADDADLGLQRLELVDWRLCLATAL